MVSHAPVALDYEVGTVFYPRLRDAPRWLLVLIALLTVPIAVGCWMIINARLFGWSADALISEMKRWRPGRRSVNCSNRGSSPTMGS